MDALTTVLVVGLVVAGLAGLLVWRVVRRVKAVAGYSRRQIVQARGRIDEARARTLAPGPRRDAALLRQQLNAEVRAARQQLAAPDAGPVFQADARAVLAGIGTAAARLDEALRQVDTLPDRIQQRTALADLAPQVGRLVDTSRSARETMLRTARLDRERDLEALHDAVAREADALHTYERTRNDLSL